MNIDTKMKLLSLPCNSLLEEHNLLWVCEQREREGEQLMKSNKNIRRKRKESERMKVQFLSLSCILNCLGE